MPSTTVIDPIVVSPPKKWGPGYFWDITNDGGTGPGNIFIDFIAHDETTIIEQQNNRVSTITGSHSGTFKLSQYLASPTKLEQQGEQGYMRVRVFSDNSSITTSTTVPIELDMQTGVQIMVQNQLLDMVGQVQDLQTQSDENAAWNANYTAVTLPSLQDMLNSLYAQNVVTQANQTETQIPVLETIENRWQTYTAETLPQIFDNFSQILDSVTAVVTGPAGAIATSIGALFSGKTLDLIGSEEVTSGETCTPIDVIAPAGGLLYGMYLHCTTIPGWYAFTAPGTGWTPRDLAVVTIYRDEEVLYRAGVHTTTWMLYPMPGVVEFPLKLDLPVVPFEFRVTVDWGSGVCGQVWWLTLP